MGGLADEDLARRRSLLEARGDIHGLARGEGRVGLVDDHLARLDADARLETELADVIEDPQPGPDRALGVVLVRAAGSRRRP